MKRLLDFGIFEYRFKPVEILWAAAQGAAAFVIATTTAPVNYADWQAWALALGAAAARPALALIFGKRPSTGSGA